MMTDLHFLQWSYWSKNGGLSVEWNVVLSLTQMTDLHFLLWSYWSKNVGLSVEGNVVFRSRKNHVELTGR
jgi:hypothetical protein